MSFWAVKSAHWAQTDKQTHRKTPDRCFTLSAMNEASVIKNIVRNVRILTRDNRVDQQNNEHSLASEGARHKKGAGEATEGPLQSVVCTTLPPSNKIFVE